MLVLCVAFIWFMFRRARKIDRFIAMFRKHLVEEYQDLRIVKEFGSIFYVSHNGRDYVLDSRNCYRACKKNPEDFSVIVDDYLFRVIFVKSVSVVPKE